MIRRVLFVLAGVLVLAVVGGAVAWGLADLPRRQEYRIRALDLSHAMGLGLPARDLAHMRQRSGLQDVSNVGCRNCHGETTNSLAWARPRPRHPSPGGLAVSADGKRLYCALPDLDEVVEADAVALRVLRRARVSGTPMGVALAPDGASLFVACRGGDRVARVALGELVEVESAFVGIGPVGIACAATTNGVRLLVANGASDDLSLLGTEPLRELVRLSAGREPYGVGFAPDGRRAYAASRLATMPGVDRAPSAELTVVDVGRGRVAARPPLVSSHLSEAAVAVPGRDWVLTPIVRVRNLVPITQVARGWVMSAGLAIADAAGRGVVQVPVDEANRYFADPAALVVEGSGRRAYLASAGGDAVSVIDLDRLAAWLAQADEATKLGAIHDLELADTYVVARIPTGRNPRQLALSPEGSRLYVAEYLEDTVLVVDTRTLAPVGRLVLGDGKGGQDDPIRRGERMFTWAGKTFQGQFSCRSCHPDGHVDGLNYDFDGDGVGDNLLDNRTLQGLAGTWPFKWNGKNPSLSVQCGPRFAKVLMRTDPFDGPQLADLTRFVESMPPPRTRHVLDTEWTPARERGRQLFFATADPGGKPIPVERRCSTCHRPPLYTNRAKTSVGTRGPQDPTDEFDTPHLLGIAASAPYLHDGRAKSLEELWTLYQTNDLHGVSSYMSKQQLNDLVEYLKTL
jgi:DNA-binding beta-propeller fold protein YncE